MLSILTGLVAGSLHVVTGPDHLAALAPLALRDRARALRTGASWGFGHGIGVVVVGLIAMLAQQVIDAHWVSAWSEFLVGFLLLGVGGWALWSASRLTTPGAVTVHAHPHVHAHDHEEQPRQQQHEHLHVHVGPTEHDRAAHRGHMHAALGVGMLHGAAGTGHLLGVVPALALDVTSALVYLGCYLVGAVASMALFGAALGALAERGGPRVIQILMVASGIVAIAVGAWWLTAGPPI